MENIQLILSLAGTTFSLLVACVTFVIKLVRSVRRRVREEGAAVLMNAVAPIVEIAEGFGNYSGAEKKEYVLTKVNQYAIENSIEFNAQSVSDKIEQLVELSRQVNRRE